MLSGYYFPLDEINENTSIAMKKILLTLRK